MKQNRLKKSLELPLKILIENKKELIPLIDSFKSSLEEIEKAISEDDKEKIKEILKQSRIKRQSFNE